jgi:Mlc titration factor MtfA (ptsG expression regulator)
MNKYESVVKSIVSQQGGNREKEILKNPHTIKKGETWNREHKVLNILEIEADVDGYKNGFQVDIVTRSIVG